MSPVAALVHVGARVVPLLWSTCPAVPLAKSTVVSAADWYGIVPPEPPAMLVALPEVNPAAVPVTLVMIPEIGVPSAGPTKVLLLKVSVVARPTKVSVAAGRVRVVAPATAEAFKIVVPLVLPAMISFPTPAAAPNVLAPVIV